LERNAFRAILVIQAINNFWLRCPCFGQALIFDYQKRQL